MTVTPSSASPSEADLEQSQRALELRKFFAPFDPNLPAEDQVTHGFNNKIQGDGALSAFAEIVLWRLRGVRTMVSLIDGNTQYFLAGAAKAQDDTDPVHLDETWFGCSTVATPGGLCENTLAITGSAEDYPCFQVTDLSLDERFSKLPVVDGSVAAYKFYAGSPIITDNGTNIGSIFVFDDKPRPEGLSYAQRKCLNEMASSVMRHLETKREAAERRRATMMSQGIARFLEMTSKETEEYEHALENLSVPNIISRAQSPGEYEGAKDESPGGVELQDDDRSIPGNILDKIKLTLDHAATILHSSLEIFSGGVVFLDTALGHHEAAPAEDYFSDKQVVDSGTDCNISVSEVQSIQSINSRRMVARGGNSPGQVRSSDDDIRPAKVLAMSATTWNPGSNSVDGKTLQSLINAYPKGNVWYIDEKGFFSTLEQVNDIYEIGNRPKSSGRRRSIASKAHLTRQKSEAAMLSKVFHKARQVIFLPIWDLAGKHWHSGCFVWSQSAVPVFTVDADIAYLLAFTNSVMVEISRLDAITANTMKSNFISSISHEFRSPLHGILASSEFMRETTLDSTQIEYISAIENCGSTLLDTINHVLEYSKINSFQKEAGQEPDPSNGLHETCNIAILCEEVITGMIAATRFKGPDSDLLPPRLKQQTSGNHPIEIILNFEHRDWNYRIQPGALRRIIMNLFGNAQKFTPSGFIHVRLSVRHTDSSGKQNLVINIIDSGVGISAEYMQRKLYMPFAQDDSFSTGVGLGLSIVHSIVTQLEGKIQIRSEPGEGTDVEVVLPLKEISNTIDKEKLLSERADMSIAGSAAAQVCLLELREAAKDRTVAVRWPEITTMTASEGATSTEELLQTCLRSYLQDWFGFTVVSAQAESCSTPDLVIIPYSYFHSDCYSEVSTFQAQCPILLLREGAPRAIEQRRNFTRSQSTPHEPLNVADTNTNQLIRTTYYPLGPFKLASAISGLLHDARKATQISTKEVGVAPSETLHPTTVSIVPVNTHPDTPLPSPQIDVQLESNSLPLRPNLSSSNTTPLPNSLPEAAIGLSILAVDDNHLNLALLHRYLLKRKGGSNDRIILARDGVEAVREARTLIDGKIGIGEKQADSGFDVIFMDISMPLMDGFEATRQIRMLESLDIFAKDFEQDGPSPLLGGEAIGGGEIVRNSDSLSGENTSVELPGTGSGNDNVTVIDNTPARNSHRAYIVALTGLGSSRDREEAAESGVDEFLTKPVGFARVGEILGRVSREKAGRLARVL